MSDRLESVLRVFREACDLDADRRSEFLDAECGDDRELRAEVESMLAFDADDDDGELDKAPSRIRSALDGLVDEARSDALPERIGGYEIVKLIAHGGMGVVYEGRQEQPSRRVAIKVARSTSTSQEHAKRFALEAQLLARLEHPGIAQIIEAGTQPAEQGAQPFFVMEYVEGEAVTKFAETQGLSLREKLELIVRVAEPVAFAHAQGVIHRDLKPDNILIGRDGAPKVLDFGVAKVEAAAGFDAATMRTEVGRVIGTLGYMAPEQLAGESDSLTASADVYSLGVLCYELLTGRLPHDLEGVTLSRALAVVHQVDAPLLGVVRPECRGDIEAVVAKALEKSPRDRYVDAADFVADIDRVLREEPVLARPHSTLHRLRKFARRNRALVGGVAATILALTIGLIATLVFARGEATQRERFDRLAAVMEHDRLIEAVPSLDPAWPDKIDALESWVRDGNALLAKRPDLERTVQELATASDDAKGFLRETLEELLEDMLRLEKDALPKVQRKLVWARNVASLTLEHPNARFTWDQARKGIAASDKYAGQEIELADADVLGLVPIGPNPKSKLWEFYHLRSAWDGESDPSRVSIPTQRADGSIDMQGSTGIVFVLIPGGSFWMGEQKKDEKLPNYHPRARGFESRGGLAHRVSLDPYLISKYEVTQGQWARLTGGQRPSSFRTGRKPGAHGEPPPIGDDRHPVEMVTWEDCDTVLRRFALTIPTEARWERACRAGTTTPWHSGDKAESLEGYANIQDKSVPPQFRRARQATLFNDGWIGTAPVGTYKPNAFGLYDMHGNVSEWVRERLPAPYETPVRKGDGFRPRTEAPGFGANMTRGGSLMHPARRATSAFRQEAAPGMAVFALGIRPGRELQQK